MLLQNAALSVDNIFYSLLVDEFKCKFHTFHTVERWMLIEQVH